MQKEMSVEVRTGYMEDNVQLCEAQRKYVGTQDNRIDHLVYS